MRVKGVVREAVGDFTAVVFLLISRSFLMNTMTTSFLEEKVVERVAPGPLGKARVGGETRVVAMDSHSHAIIAVAQSAWSEIAHMARDTGRGKQPKLISAQHLPTK